LSTTRLKSDPNQSQSLEGSDSSEEIDFWQSMDPEDSSEEIDFWQSMDPSIWDIDFDEDAWEAYEYAYAAQKASEAWEASNGKGKETTGMPDKPSIKGKVDKLQGNKARASASARSTGAGKGKGEGARARARSTRISPEKQREKATKASKNAAAKKRAAKADTSSNPPAAKRGRGDGKQEEEAKETPKKAADKKRAAKADTSSKQ
jgi:hypothetical protein